MKHLSFVLILVLVLSVALCFVGCGEKATDNTNGSSVVDTSSTDSTSSTVSEDPTPKKLNPKEKFDFGAYEIFRPESLADDGVGVKYIYVSFWAEPDTQAIVTYHNYLTKKQYDNWCGFEVDEDSLPGEEDIIKIDGVTYYREQSFGQDEFIYEITDTEIILKNYETEEVIAKFSLYEDNTLVLDYSKNWSGKVGDVFKKFVPKTTDEY